MLIFLTGMPGAGKTTLGAGLAMLLGYDFTDLDPLIEEQEGMSIPRIFESKGEGYFREAEKKALHSLQGKARMVVATGGGTPCFFDNLAWMKEQGATVFLDLPLEVLAQRLANPGQAERPLLQQNKGKIEIALAQTFLERRQFYEKAALVIPAADITAEELAQLLRKRLRLAG